MIVHPIGMMRANAASGLNFVDDFTTYTTGQNLVGQGPYDQATGYINYMTVEDASGTRVAQLAAGDALHVYNGQTVANDRRVSLKIHNHWTGSGGHIGLYLSNVDADNYAWAKADSYGWLMLVVVNSGVTQLNQGFNIGVTDGDELELSYVGSTFTAKRNGSQIYQNPSVTVSTMGNPGIRMRAIGSGGTGPAQVSLFKIEEL